MSREDKYKNYEELKQNEKEGHDYKIEIRPMGTKIAVIAIHGGDIEPGTTEVARAIAAQDLSFYSFIGIKSKRNGDLHITSHDFDEPECLSLLKIHDIAISIHGEDDQENSFVRTSAG